MKVLVVAHGWPAGNMESGGGRGDASVSDAAPEAGGSGTGGTEQLARRSALALVAAGAEVSVLAGSLVRAPATADGGARLTSGTQGPLRVLRLQRGDLFFDHWQKSRSVPATRLFRQVLAQECPDVVLIHHWIRLSRDLVFQAAAAGIPALVYLHDHYSSCLRVFRLAPFGNGPAGKAPIGEAPIGKGPAGEGPAERAGGTVTCAEPFGSGCISCAADLFPRTPWVSLENLHLAFASHGRELARELRLARAVITPSRSHRDLLLAGYGPELAADIGRSDEAPGRWHVLAPPVLPFDAPGGVMENAPAAAPGYETADEAGDAAAAAAGPRRIALPVPGTPSAGEAAGAQAVPLVLGCWGQLAPHKGTDLLLAALDLVAESRPVELHLAGGCEAQYLDELKLAASGLMVHFHGPFERADLPLHPVSAVHAFVCPSRAPESHGLVFDEALALGLPAVLPRSGAFPERAAAGVPGDGPLATDAEVGGVLFYSPGDARDLARVLERLAGEDGLLLRLRAAAAERARALAEVSVDGTGDGAGGGIGGGSGGDSAGDSGGGSGGEHEWGRRLLDLCEAAVAEGAPQSPAADWFEEPMALELERQWDAALARTPPDELGA
ncbi:MAG: glycosyltransferase [Planctomycetota bacterium]|nr:glycosyltransferase [Planctomycetota bacterium]